jgi:hypothetical protein
MKLFYTLTLLLGVMMAIVMQFVSIAIPKDAFTASVLFRSPESWTISMNDALSFQLSHHDVKTELVTALEKRASFRNEIYSQSLWQGLALIVLSFIGLIREKKIDKMKKKNSKSTDTRWGLQ